nr:Basic helix-loop-helix dimerisation region bHLH domain containing protein [Haemonchus contortus]
MPSSPQLRGSRPNQERRNARERNRVHQVNHGFDLLRTRVPKAGVSKKLSKADTLREAVRYIQYLQSLLHADGGNNQTGYPPPSCSVNSSIYAHSDMEFDVYFPTSAPVSTTSSQNPSPVHSMYCQPPVPQPTNPGARPYL